MNIQHLTLTNFRCFTQYHLDLNHQYVVFQGPNGSGKSSLLEALHYGCYLRSFRTHNQKELVQLGQDHFTLQIGIELQRDGYQEQDSVHIGYSVKDGKVVRYNQKPVGSYKDLIAHYRLISLAEHDLAMIAGAPEVRREFLTYALLLDKPELVPQFKQYRQTLEQRNSLLFNAATRTVHLDELEIWSARLWQESFTIRTQRQAYLKRLCVWVNSLLGVYQELLGKELQLECRYQPRGGDFDTFEQFWSGYYPARVEQEKAYKRTLFGAHLDDFGLTFNQKNARFFASRGQQKLLIFLIKVAQLRLLQEQGFAGVLLLDDFLTDFDALHVRGCVQVLRDLSCQVFFTVPHTNSILDSVLAGRDALFLTLS